MRSPMSRGLNSRIGEESSDMTVAFDLHGGDGVFRFLALGFGVHGLYLKGLDDSVESKYSMFSLLRDCEIERWVGCLGVGLGMRIEGFCRL